eukprot:scaffold9520_cov45-Attheya_sp.AAC.3
MDFMFGDHINNLLNNDQFDPNTEGSDMYQTTLEEERVNIPYGNSPVEKNPAHDRWYLRGGGGSGPPIARNATTNYLFCLLDYEQ